MIEGDITTAFFTDEAEDAAAPNKQTGEFSSFLLSTLLNSCL